jgi:hypothetical protein
MNKRIVIFEAEGGSDKWIFGHRKDTMPIVEAIMAKGWEAEVVFFRDEWRDIIHDYVYGRFDGYISRVNPGTLANGEAMYFDFMRSLSELGMVGMSHPDAMIGFGAKDMLVKLADTPLVPDDTFAYYKVSQFEEMFPVSLSRGERVLKQNRGSTGSGIWHVEVIDEEVEVVPGERLPLSTKVKCTEAVDNHVEYHALGEFMIFCEKYIIGDQGMIVDMQYLPRIKEGEIRILMVGSSPIFVVHKKPAEGEDSFSATLFSGAKYRYDDPEDWSDLVTMFLDNLPMITKKLGGFDIPLIWTADFMLDWDENGNDRYILGEFNNSCVGFTSHLDRGIQEKIADEAIRLITEKLS